MASALLAIIYLAFISLGLPDSLLGSAWPVMQAQMQVPVSYAGVISMIIAGGTILSSLMSDRLTKRFGAGLVTAVSVLMTAAALMGFSLSGSFVSLCLWSIPYGLGAGAVDAALNNYVAVHYASRHMSWLHCFWGIGASVSPYIMSFALTGGLGWQSGYRIVSILQIALTIVLMASLPLWGRQKVRGVEETSSGPVLKLSQIISMRGVPFVLLTFFGYCAMETTTGLWAASYLVMGRGIDADTAAQYASLFYLGITAGRFLCGFIADRLGDRLMIRVGLAVITLGMAALGLPLGVDWPPLAGLVMIGFGSAPIYPSIIHATPANFGPENSQAIIGVQMASAYAGSTFMPPLFGFIAGKAGITLYPAFLFVFVVLMIVMNELLNRTVPMKQIKGS